MKAARVLIAVALLAVVALPMQGASAQATTYSSCVQLVNLDAVNAATVVLTFYDQSGTSTPYSDPNPIPAGQSRTYCPLPGISNGFNGSAVVSSNTQLAAITNVYTSGGNYASYTGFQAGGTEALVPLLMKNNYGYSTWFNVQNTGTVSTTLTVTYSDGIVATYANLPAGTAHTFDQSTEAHANGWVGSATVTTSNGTPIAVSAIENGPTLFSYNGFGAGSTAPVMPLVQANNFGYFTGISLFNNGTVTTTATIVYTPSTAGSVTTETHDIAPGQIGLYALSVFGTNTFVGSGKVTENTADQPLTAVVNQLNTAAVKGGSYGAFDPSAATATVVFPLIMDRNYGFFTGFNVQNVGTQSTTVTCAFTNSTRTVSATLAPGEALNDVQLNQLSSGYVGAATCTASGGDQKIVGVANELNLGSAVDSLLVYEGTNH